MIHRTYPDSKSESWWPRDSDIPATKARHHASEVSCSPFCGFASCVASTWFEVRLVHVVCRVLKSIDSVTNDNASKLSSNGLGETSRSLRNANGTRRSSILSTTYSAAIFLLILRVRLLRTFRRNCLTVFPFLKRHIEHYFIAETYLPAHLPRLRRADVRHRRRSR